MCIFGCKTTILKWMTLVEILEVRTSCMVQEKHLATTTHVGGREVRGRDLSLRRSTARTNHLPATDSPTAMHPSTLLSLLLFLLPNSTLSVHDSLYLTHKAVFILAGQSNMAGRGGVYNDTAIKTTVWDTVVPPECRSNPSVLRLSANLTWVKAHEPLHADIDVNKTNGIGPGMAFANTLLSKEPRFGVVGLVPCAIGGTKIREWQRGTFLYDQLTRRAQAALLNGGRLRAVLWYQGESDCDDKTDAEIYKERLKRFFLDIVADLQSPGIPILQVWLYRR